MPIRRHHRWLYPIDWHELSAAIQFRRAKDRCEGCVGPHGRVVLHLGDGAVLELRRSLARWRGTQSPPPSRTASRPASVTGGTATTSVEIVGALMFETDVATTNDVGLLQIVAGW